MEQDLMGMTQDQKLQMLRTYCKIMVTEPVQVLADFSWLLHGNHDRMQKQHEEYVAGITAQTGWRLDRVHRAAQRAGLR